MGVSRSEIPAPESWSQSIEGFVTEGAPDFVDPFPFG